MLNCRYKNGKKDVHKNSCLLDSDLGDLDDR